MFSPAHGDAPHRLHTRAERRPALRTFPSPHPRVQLQSEAVSLKSQRLPHQDICRLVRSSENPLRSDRRQVPEGGIERLKNPS
jgi:hypothetical protein